MMINLVFYWARGYREPWYLATSLDDPRRAVRMYGRRIQQEQYFEDGKQCIGLDQSTITTTHWLLVALLLVCCRLSWPFCEHRQRSGAGCVPEGNWGYCT